MQYINVVNSEIWVPRTALIVPKWQDFVQLDDRVIRSDGDFVRNFERYIDGEKTVVILAYIFAAIAHNNQMRANGEPYMNHLLGVYNILKHDFGADEESRAAGLLHDTVEDTPVTLEAIYHLFGPEIGFLVDGMTKPQKTSPFEEGHSRYREKFFAYAKKDPRLIQDRLSDRGDNMKTVGCFREEKRARIARETLELYLPLSVGTPIHKELEYLTNLHLRN